MARHETLAPQSVAVSLRPRLRSRRSEQQGWIEARPLLLPLLLLLWYSSHAAPLDGAQTKQRHSSLVPRLPPASPLPYRSRGPADSRASRPTPRLSLPQAGINTSVRFYFFFPPVSSEVARERRTIPPKRSRGRSHARDVTIDRPNKRFARPYQCVTSIAYQPSRFQATPPKHGGTP